MIVQREKKTIEVWNVCECGQILHSIREGTSGQCASCWVKAMPSDTKEAMNKLIASVFQKHKPTDDEKGKLIDDAMSKLDRDSNQPTK